MSELNKPVQRYIDIEEIKKNTKIFYNIALKD